MGRIDKNKYKNFMIYLSNNFYNQSRQIRQRILARNFGLSEDFITLLLDVKFLERTGRSNIRCLVSPTEINEFVTPSKIDWLIAKWRVKDYQPTRTQPLRKKKDLDFISTEKLADKGNIHPNNEIITEIISNIPTNKDVVAYDVEFNDILSVQGYLEKLEKAGFTNNNFNQLLNIMKAKGVSFTRKYSIKSEENYNLYVKIVKLILEEEKSRLDKDSIKNKIKENEEYIKKLENENMKLSNLIF